MQNASKSVCSEKLSMMLRWWYTHVFLFQMDAAYDWSDLQDYADLVKNELLPESAADSEVRFLFALVLRQKSFSRYKVDYALIALSCRIRTYRWEKRERV